MIGAASAWAWAQRTGSPAGKAVLVALAHDARGGICRSTAAGLAQATQLSALEVRNALDDLEGRGLIRREQDGCVGMSALVVRLKLPGAAL